MSDGLPVNQILPAEHLRAPFPWFGGKSAVTALVWERFGDVPNFVEPFFGSGAVLLGRPGGHAAGLETVNDKDGYIANFWRAIQHDPEAVARYADNPVNENDLHARHAWLVNQKAAFVPQLEGDPEFYDARIAGWWCWGICCWIGSGFCSGSGPWQIVNRQLLHLGNKGQGVNRQLLHLGNKGQGVNRQLLHLGNKGRGVNRQRVAITNDGIGCTHRTGGIYDWFTVLAERLRYVRVCCGDWSRICGPTPTTKQGLTGVFLDPPYAVAERADCYNEECRKVAHAVREWALAQGGDSQMRVALCGYEGEHEMPGDWECLPWKTRGGYGSQSRNGNDNCRRERIWFSPHCLKPDAGLFTGHGSRDTSHSPASVSSVPSVAKKKGNESLDASKQKGTA